MTTVAKRYGISDVALRKQCRKLDIPLPKRSYGAKAQAGHRVEVPPLPKSEGPDKNVVVVSNPHRTALSDSKATNKLLFLPEEEREAVQRYCAGLIVPSEPLKFHGLVADTIQYHRARKESTKPPVNRVINVNVSDAQKERVYIFSSTIFVAFEHLGYSVAIEAPRSEQYYRYRHHIADNELHVGLGEDGVEIRIKEQRRRVEHKSAANDRYHGPSYGYEHTGELRFAIESYYAPRKNWRDTKTKKIEDQVGEIVIGVMEAIEVEKNLRLKREAERIEWEKRNACAYK